MTPPAKPAIHRVRVRAVFTVAVYTVMAPFGYFFFALAAAIPMRDRSVRARRLQRVQAAAYRFMHDWLRLVGITDFDHRRYLGAESEFQRPTGPAVVVANHPTLMDVTAVTAVLGGGFTIVKPQLYNRWMLHPLLVGAGHVAGPGDDPVSVGRVVDEAVQQLQAGMSLIVFPEGTRSYPDRLRNFGRTAFEIACRAGVPIVSIGIRCDPVYLSKEVTVFRPPKPTAVLDLRVLAVDDPTAADVDSRVLRRRVEDRFREWFSCDLAARDPHTYSSAGKDPQCPIRSKIV